VALFFRAFGHVVAEVRLSFAHRRFEALREFIPVNDKKLDKAGFLHEAVTYVRDLQDLLRKCLDLGAVDHLSEEEKWAYRMLLPHRDSQGVSQSAFARAHRACEKPVSAPKGFPADASKESVSLHEKSVSPNAVLHAASSTEVNPSGVIFDFLMQQQMQQQQALLQWLCACNPAMVRCPIQLIEACGCVVRHVSYVSGCFTWEIALICSFGMHAWWSLLIWHSVHCRFCPIVASLEVMHQV
jgi:hypothetical protein